MTKVFVLSAVLGLSALGMACGGTEANKPANNTNAPKPATSMAPATPAPMTPATPATTTAATPAKPGDKPAETKPATPSTMKPATK